MADLPPRDTWLANGNGLTRWRPAFDLIEVHPTPSGKIVRLRFDGVERKLYLTQEQAAYLAKLLSGT